MSVGILLAAIGPHEDLGIGTHDQCRSPECTEGQGHNATVSSIEMASWSATPTVLRFLPHQKLRMC